MKKKRIFLTLAGLLFLLLIGTEVTINKKIENSIGQSLYVFSFASGEESFSKDQNVMLKDTEYDICFLTETELTVKSFRSVGTMQIIGTNENFRHLSNKKIVSGAWFNTLQVERKNKVAVLSEATALQYFGTTNIVSNEIEIDGSKYEVIGVIKEEDGANIYIPLDNIEAYHKTNVEYSQLWCNLQNEAELSLFLQKLGIKDSEINIFRGGEYQRIVNLRIKIIFGIIGLLLIVQLLKHIKRIMKQLVFNSKIFFERNYAMNIAELIKRKKTIQQILSLLFCTGALIGIYEIIRFKLVLPNAEIINMNEKIITRISYVLEFYMQPHIWVESLQFMNKWNLLSVVVFFLNLLLGSIIIWVVMERCGKK